jgi:hypothetical protein
VVVAGGISAGALALLAPITGRFGHRDGAATSTGSSGTTSATTAPSGDATADPYRQPDWIALENTREGADDWGVSDDPEVWARVRGFADTTSVNRAGPVTLFVATDAPTFDVEAFRIGWYATAGARLLWEQRQVTARPQPEPTMDPVTRMVEAPWSPSLVVPVTRAWPPGCYVFRLTSPDGGESYVPLTIRDDESPSPLLVQNSVTTWQAYNDWGGASLYSGSPGQDPDLRSDVVSFDRPYGGNGSGEFFGRERELIYLVEQLGLDVTYWTDLDLHADPERVQRHRALVSLGHDEYYSTVMRRGLEDARDAGVNLAFLGANAVYRRIRLEASPLGPHRRQVNYRVAANDPLTGIDDENVTTSFREPPAADPESTLIGNFYECNPVEGDMVVVDPDAWIFAGANVAQGEVFPGIVGNEYDRVNPAWPTPENIQVLAHSPVTCKGDPSYADMTYYTAESGAGVLATGTLWWIREHLLVDCRDEWDDPVTWQAKVQKITETMLRTFAEGRAGDRHPSRGNLDELDIVAEP